MLVERVQKNPLTHERNPQALLQTNPLETNPCAARVVASTVYPSGVFSPLLTVGFRCLVIFCSVTQARHC